MIQYVAFLRGVMPTNCKMPELKRAFELAGFKNVLSSGNVVFSFRKSSEQILEQKIEKAIQKHLDRNFMTFVHTKEDLESLIESDLFNKFKIVKAEKCVVTFMRDKAKTKIKFPIEEPGVRILKEIDGKVLTAYFPNNPKGPVFMKMLETHFGKDITTRTLDTIKKAVLK